MFQKSTNQKQELHVVAMFVNRSGQNEQKKKIKSWTIINIFCLNIPLLFPPRITNWIYRPSTGYLNCTCHLTSSVLFQSRFNETFFLLTPILSAIKNRLQSNSDTSYSRCGVNQLQIRQHATDLFEHYNIIIFDFPTFTQLFPTQN